MSRLRASLHTACARADEAYRRLFDHCLGECPNCRAYPPQQCDAADALRRAWARARWGARR